MSAPHVGAWCSAPTDPTRACWFDPTAHAPSSLLMTAICGKRFRQRLRVGDFGPRDALPGRYRCKACRSALKAAS